MNNCASLAIPIAILFFFTTPFNDDTNLVLYHGMHF